MGGWETFPEGWEYRRKLRRFAPDLQTPNSAATPTHAGVLALFCSLAIWQHQERLRGHDSTRRRCWD
ncbi:MAG: hypothetical protein U0521_17360 [Anaerolineae bacterium]